MAQRGCAETSGRLCEAVQSLAGDENQALSTGARPKTGLSGHRCRACGLRRTGREPLPPAPWRREEREWWQVPPRCGEIAASRKDVHSRLLGTSVPFIKADGTKRASARARSEETVPWRAFVRCGRPAGMDCPGTEVMAGWPVIVSSFAARRRQEDRKTRANEFTHSAIDRSTVLFAVAGMFAVVRPPASSRRHGQRDPDRHSSARHARSSLS